MDSTYYRLLKEIKEKSRRGMIAWSPSSYSATFQAPLGKGMITIMFDPELPATLPVDYDPPVATLSFLNERGETFNSINAFSTKDDYYTDLVEIYTSARNGYMKIDETVQSMFDDLQARN
ncbi:MAG: hypothetical protein K2K97_02050 [Muribaculaceae bacterium]|nr:hypothetical protein [Muribaculaceae bacterium]